MICSFFLGANTHSGFYSLFNELDGFDLTVVKGGPGSGKSTLMKSLLAKNADGGLCEKILCSSDVNSLDGAVFHQSGVAIADGTAPHTCESANLGTYISMPPLCGTVEGKRKLIASLKSAKKSAYTKAYGALSGFYAAESVMKSLLCFDEQKLVRRADGIAMREAKNKGVGGKVHRRFLDSISKDGFLTLWDTVERLCSKVYVIDDRYRLGAGLLKRLEVLFTDKGYDVFSCMSPFSPEGLRHLIIPELKLAFITSDGYSSYNGDAFRHVHTLPYIDKSAFRQNAQKVRFYEKLCASLFSQAQEHLNDAYVIHRQLEGVYRPHLDIDALNRLAEEVSLS